MSWRWAGCCLFSYFKRMHQAELGYQHAEVALTHQWGSLLDVTTIISSLKKARCSELTALQSTRALTSLWWGLLPETWSIHKSNLMNFIEQRQNRPDITVKAFFCVCTIAFLRGRGMQLWTGEDGRAGAGAGTGVRLLPTKLQYSSSWLPTLFGDSVLHLPWLPPPPLVRRYDIVFSELQKSNRKITSSQTVYRLDNDMSRDHCSIALPDRPDVVLSDTALRTRTSTSVTLPALLLCPEQSSLSVWGLWWFSHLALAFCAGWRRAVPALCLRTRVGGRVRGSPWIGSAFLCCDWNLGVWTTCGRKGRPIKDRVR